MQNHLFTNQSPYHTPDWQHHPSAAAQHHYAAQNQAAAAANAVAQQHQQNYGRAMSAAGQNHAANTNGNTPASLAGIGAAAGLGGGGGGLEHGGGMGPGENVSEENRRVLDWIAQVLRADTRESALLELSKKREQVPELALILWHSFGECAHCQPATASASVCLLGMPRRTPLKLRMQLLTHRESLC